MPDNAGALAESSKLIVRETPPHLGHVASSASALEGRSLPQDEQTTCLIVVLMTAKVLSPEMGRRLRSA